MVRIPTEYQEVEYIESTGTQFIDTGYIPVLSPVLRMKIRITDQNDKDIAGFVSNVYPSFIIDAFPAQSRWYNRYGDTAAYGVNYGPVVGQIQEWEWGKEVKFNGKVVRTNTECDWSSNTQKMNIFSGRTKAYVAIYSCSLYDGELVRNFIPCYRKSDNEIGMYDTVTGTFYTNQGTGIFLKGNDVTYDPISLLETRRKILLNTPHIESASGSIATFNTDMSTNITDMKIHFHPVQEGTGDPSPDNVRPITGWDGVTVIKTGKNLAANGTYCGRLKVTDNKYANSVYYCYYFPIPKSKIYIAKQSTSVPLISVSDEPPAIGVSAIANTGIPTMTYVKYHTFDNTEIGAKYMCIHGGNRSEFSDLTVLLDGTELMITTDGYCDEYEASTNNLLEIPISFGRTIYGGYVDLVNGEVVEEWIRREMSAFSSIYGPNSSSEPWNHRFNVRNWMTGAGYDRKTGGDIRVYSDVVKSNNGLGKTNYTADDSTANWYIYDNTISTVAEFKEKYAGHYAVYRLLDSLATTYSLTPQTIKALKGINNIWSDANGNVEVKFWKH